MYTTLIGCETLSHSIGKPNWVVVDCRFDLMQPQAGYMAYQAGHLPGAVYADLNKDLSAAVTSRSGRHPLPDPTSFARQLGRWGISNASQVVVYDAGNGAYAVRLWWMLRWLGHPAVALLDGGLAAWQAAGLPLTVAIPQPSPAHFEVQLQSDYNVSTAQVRQGIEEGTLTVVDARTAARYAGEVEPIDPVAGHIPTALNYPYEANLDAQGRFLSTELLRSRFMTLAVHPEQVVHMCGSGVTACHNLLAMEIAGLAGSKLYAGSWSEWVRDPGNPITKGCQA
jgi:thiosulfate/3-mercaptopyruvate sulfurtransferase